ncbi:MAG: hypothetical protein HYU64_21545 [Armatimonadetes bacterium]|nr:hypothetical protein [Armatimonadota bacterium]
MRSPGRGNIERAQGIILITTLLVLFFLILLTTSLLAVNRHNIGLFANLENHEKAYQAAVTGLQYAQHQMEVNLYWPYQPSGPSPAVSLTSDSNFGAYETTVNAGGSKETRIIVGILKGNNSHFQINFSPDIGTSSKGCTRYKDSEIEKYPTSGPGSWGAPVDFKYKSLNNLRAASGSSNVENRDKNGILYRWVAGGKAHLIVTGYCRGTSRTIEVVLQKKAGVDSSAVANGNLSVTGALWTIDSKDPNSNFVRSNNNIIGPGASQTTTFGTTSGSGKAWSKEYITLRGLTLGDGLNDDVSETDTVQTATNGIMKPKSSAYEIPDLDSTAITSGRTTSNIAPGYYKFLAQDKVIYSADGVTYNPGNTYTGVIKDGGNDAIYLKDYNFIVPNPVKVNGSLTLLRDPSVTSRPKLSIGYDKNLAPVGTSPFLEIKDNLDIKGELKGNGSVVATSTSSKITFEGKSQLSTTPEKGVAIYSGGDVSMKPIDTSADLTSDPGVGLPEYYDRFQEAIGGAPYPKNQGYIDDVNFPSYYGGEWNGIGPNKDKGFNKWLEWDEGDQKGVIGSSDVASTTNLRGQTVTYNPTTDAWWSSMPLTNQSQILNFLAGAALTNDPAAPPAATTTLGLYLRVKEYMKTVRSGDTKGDLLDLSREQDTISDIVMKQIEAYATKAKDEKTTLQTYMGRVSTNIEAQDIQFLGLLYSKNSFTADAGGYKFSIEGSLVTKDGGLTISNASEVHFTYNPDFVGLLKRGAGSGTQLEQVSWLTW